MIEKYGFRFAGVFAAYALIVAVGAIVTESSSVGRDLAILACVTLVFTHVVFRRVR